MVQIHPSLLALDFSKLSPLLAAIKSADYLHIDIMDGHFVPNHTFGPHILQTVKKLSKLPFEIHLLVTNPLDHIDTYLPFSSRFIIHAESDNPEKAIKKIHSEHGEAGIAINPDTPIETIIPFLKKADFICMMSVHPGFSGQSFLRSTIARLAMLRRLMEDKQLELPILLDGGITPELISQLAADNYVVGNSLFFDNKPDAIAKRLYTMKSL